MMIALSTVTPFTLEVGAACLVAQVVLTALLAYATPGGPWKEQPGLTAHQIVCLPLMMYLTYQGFCAYVMDDDQGTAPFFTEDNWQARLFTIWPRGREMASIAFGMMLLWDIPCSLLLPALQEDMVMLAHHVGMIFMAGLSLGTWTTGSSTSGDTGHPIGTYYAPFFFGVLELSSVFLTLVDLFHPKNAAWHAWLTKNTENPSLVVRTAQSVNEVCRICFALAFLLVRGLIFPYVMFTGCLPDVLQAVLLETDQERYGVSRVVLLLVLGLGFFFTCLQMYWAFLVTKQVAKALGMTGSETEKKKSKKDN